ncbi:MAG: hypothetical protein ABW172_07475 [Candidatus Binatia bacterium]
MDWLIDVDAVWPDEHAAAKAPDLFPVSSKRWTGFALLPRQPRAIPGEDRSVAQTDLPSLTCSAAFDPVE